jgi:AMP nucleosidase
MKNYNALSQDALTRLLTGGVTKITHHYDAVEIVARLIELYDEQVAHSRAVVAGLAKGKSPGQFATLSGCYPMIAVPVDAPPEVPSTEAYGFCRNGVGLYTQTIARPELFRNYLLDQIDRLLQAHGGPIFVGVSPVPIPVQFVTEVKAIPDRTRRIIPPTSSLSLGLKSSVVCGDFHLGLFPAPAVDDRLGRLAYYSGTAVEHFQSCILVTNYQSYLRKFVEWAAKEVKRKGSGYTELVRPAADWEGKEWWAKPQMPAYHLKRADGSGITLVDIGVGHSNAMTFMDVIAPIRPAMIMMVGHCAGLRQTHRIGTFLIGDAYFRDPSLGDLGLDANIPVPPITEINHALVLGVGSVFKLGRTRRKGLVERGTIASTARRLWETDTALVQQIVDAGAIAVDMETVPMATLAFQYRIPFATCLVVSDCPTRGQLKTDAAREFHRGVVDNHLHVAISAINRLRRQRGGIARVVSRKLYPANAAAFR